MSSQLNVLVVCLGNICRSPMGEAVLRQVAAERGIDLKVDSCGTSSYHIGEDPDERTVKTCKKHGVHIDHRARVLCEDDFRTFTHVLASDNANLRSLANRRPEDATAEVRLWGSYLDDKQISDPYYGSIQDFEKIYHQCVALSHAFLDTVAGKQRTSA